MASGGQDDPVAARNSAGDEQAAAGAPEPYDPHGVGGGGRATLPQTYITFFKSFVGIAILGLPHVRPFSIISRSLS